jgi:flagellar biosynthetic protein FliR
MDLFNVDPLTIFSFLLTLFRVSLILFVLPFFGGQSIPTVVKAALMLVLSLALWPHLNFSGVLFPNNIFMIALMLAGELFIGLILGLLVQMLFAAVQMGGQIIGFQMGFAMINVADPMTGQTVVITSHFLYMVTLLTFLSLNGHLFLLSALGQSFDLVTPGSLFISPTLVSNMLEYTGQIFVLAVKIAAPVMAALFLVDLALALIGRAAPQMNVLILGFPLKIAVGFFFIGILFKTLSLKVNDFIMDSGRMFNTVLTSLGS